MIVIIDYGMGNLKSVSNALEQIGIEYIVSSDKNEIINADGIILPGVGAFKDAMDNLKKRELVNIIRQKVKMGYPILGICLGMQMLYDEGDEGRVTEGLGLLKGKIKLMNPIEKVKIPHIGWNRLDIKRNHKILSGLSKEAYVYFVHSYMAIETKAEEVIASSEYGGIEIPALVGRKNVLGAQFHPEKSGYEGLSILKRFGEMIV